MKRLEDCMNKMAKDREIVVLMKFGSCLYGTNTERSDVDYKGIFMPTKEEIFLGKIPKTINYSSGNDDSKNTNDDIDIELYSLHYFLELAFKGETVGIDMIHCNKESLIKTSLTWDTIRLYRSGLYTKNLKGFVGFCRKQAAKYCIKGSKIETARKFLEFLYGCGITQKLGYYWDSLPLYDGMRFNDKNGKFEYLEVNGKKFQKTIPITECQKIMEKHVNSYGKRAENARLNKGIDWKAVSHAVRYAYQIKELFETKDIIFPLKEAKFLKQVKSGELNFAKEVAPVLDKLMDEIEILGETVDFPEKVNRKPWNAFMMNVMEKHVKNQYSCKACNGTGRQIDGYGVSKTCKYCKGTGKSI